MNIDFWYRPVTPGVAGSSPVHSAIIEKAVDFQRLFSFGSRKQCHI